MTRAPSPEPERPTTPASTSTDSTDADSSADPPAPEHPGAAPPKTDPPVVDPQSDRAASAAAPTDDELLGRVGSADADIEVLVACARPKYSAFIGTGVVFGLLAAVILTVTRPANPEFTTNSVLSYLSLVFGLLGGSAGGVLALALDRRSDRAARSARPSRARSTAHRPDVGG